MKTTMFPFHDPIFLFGLECIECIFPTFRAFKRYIIKNGYYKKIGFNDCWQNEVLQQSDKTQSDKNTDRKQKIDVYNNPQVPMKREQLGINNNFNVDVAQDSLNPNLENKTSRFVNLDSQYRQSTNVIENTASDYTLDLSDPLTNLLNIATASNFNDLGNGPYNGIRTY